MKGEVSLQTKSFIRVKHDKFFPFSALHEKCKFNFFLLPKPLVRVGRAASLIPSCSTAHENRIVLVYFKSQPRDV